MKRTLISLTALIALTTPALAGNLEPVAPTPSPVAAPPLPAPEYDWSGFFAGASLGYADAEAEAPGLAVDGNGATFGVRAGYDLDLGDFVVGGIVEYDETNIELGNNVAEIENVLRVGARAGYGVGRNLFYGTAGFAQANTDTLGDSDGYFAGAGYEVFLTEKVTAGAELLYHEFDDFDQGPGVEAEAATLGANINYRF